MLTGIIALFGVLICVGGLALLIVPERFKTLMNRWTGQPRFLFAVIVRIVFGALMLLEAANLKFEYAVRFIGVLSIIAAIVLLLAGQQRTDRFIAWWMRRPDRFLRAWSIAALAFGGFVVFVAL